MSSRYSIWRDWNENSVCLEVRMGCSVRVYTKREMYSLVVQ